MSTTTTMPTNTSTNTSTMTSTTPPIKATHEIKIALKDGYAVAPSTVFTMAVGETVCYSSDDGEVKIKFRAGSPYRTDYITESSVPGAVILTLVTDSGTGIIEGDCYIKLGDGTWAGYGPEYPSGVHHRVTPPHA